MKTYEKLKNLKSEVFKRLIGVKLETFKEMLVFYENIIKRKSKKVVRLYKLSVSTQISFYRI